MPNNYFLTGNVRTGKTTIIKELVTELNLTARGYTVGREGHEGNYITFFFIDPQIYFYQGIMKKEEDKIFAFRDNANKQWKVNLNVFNQTGVRMLSEGLCKDIVIIDEVGRFEAKAVAFQNKIFDILNTSKLVLGVLKEEKNLFLDQLFNNSDIQIFEVTITNREKVKNDLLSLLL